MHSRGYVEDLSIQTGRKRCTKTTVLNLSVLPKEGTAIRSLQLRIAVPFVYYHQCRHNLKFM